jgi:hypothetical protein
MDSTREEIADAIKRIALEIGGDDVSDALFALHKLAASDLPPSKWKLKVNGAFDDPKYSPDECEPMGGFSDPNWTEENPDFSQ